MYSNTNVVKSDLSGNITNLNISISNISGFSDGASLPISAGPYTL